MEFIRFSASDVMSNGNRMGFSDFKPADDGGDGNTFDRGETKFGWIVLVFFVKFDNPLKFIVNLSPPCDMVFWFGFVNFM